MERSTTRWIGGLVVVATALSAGACGENEVATEHIRSVVAQADTTAADSGAAPIVTLPNGDTLHVRHSVVAFYRDRQFAPAWTDDDEILERGLSMLEAIGVANTEGLDRERYHYTTAHHMARLLEDDAVEDRELEYLGNLDLLLTENFIRLSQDLVAGTIDPGKAGLDWQIERGEAPESELLDAVARGEDPRAVLGSVRPQVPYYDRLVRALHRLRTVEEKGGWTTVPEGETLEAGDEDPRVARVRARLQAGDDPEETRMASVGQGNPTLFDDDLKAALEHFQTRHNLHEDGAVGPTTLEALNVPVEERIQSVRLNLDRWRWLPPDLGEKFILVNVAGFELEVVDGDSAIESMNVVVGKTANRTPIFRDTLEYMVVNPYWNVPESIAEEEIFPLIERDPTYMARNNYEFVRDGGATRIRQRPGPGNALGNVKFLFPNNMNIYLHDTPADHLFSQTSRAFSHGCIRVERPDDLARTLLSALSDRDAEEYDRLRKASGEQWIEFDEKIPVYILYFTAWVDDDGTIRFHDDVYDRDRSLGPEAREKFEPVQPRPIRTEG